MTTFHAPSEDREQGDWLGLGQASRRLGVNQSTLRRWADAGLIRAFRTPGGHRRFSPDDLLRLTAAAGDVSAFDGDALHHIRERLEQADTTSPPDWLGAMTPPARHEFAGLGRQMVTLAGRYLTEDADRDALAADARRLGGLYARLLHSTGVSLADGVAAFTYFRRGMDEAVAACTQEQRLIAADAAALWKIVSELEDHVLVALTSAFEQAAAPPPALPPAPDS